MNRGIIKNVEVKVLELPLKKQWKISLYEQTTRAHAIVRITTEDGIVGFGEAAPSPAFMGETGYTMEVAVNRYLKDAVIGMDVFSTDLIQKNELCHLRQLCGKVGDRHGIIRHHGKDNGTSRIPALGRTVQGKSRPELGSRDAGFGCLD